MYVQNILFFVSAERSLDMMRHCTIFCTCFSICLGRLPSLMLLNIGANDGTISSREFFFILKI